MDTTSLINLSILIIEGIAIFAALIVHQKKANREEKKRAINNSFSWTLVLCGCLVAVDLFTSIQLELDMVDAGAILSVIYLIFYIVEVKKASVA